MERGNVTTITHIVRVILFVLLFVFSIWLFQYQKGIEGVGPALFKPPEDITKILNTTGMPLSLPPGFSIAIFAKELGAPRVLAFDPSGNLVTSIPAEGRIVALPDENHDGVADRVITIVEGLRRPHGLAFKCDIRREGVGQCKIFIAEEDAVSVFDYDWLTMSGTHKKKIIDLPWGGNHVTRTLLFLPPPNDHKLLISVGSTCNVCHESDPRRATILVANDDGTGLKEYAKGLRNAVFMTVNPFTTNVWATEMGRDWLGDDLPPDEINIIEEGKNYGWPICYGKNMHDTNFDRNMYIRNPCEEPFETPSAIDLPAHSAPLGLAFIEAYDWIDSWPEEYIANLLVSYHGSWNRSNSTGYKIVRHKFDTHGTYLGEEDFIAGWLTKEGALGRPVDLLFNQAGTLFISDDKAGVIYRVVYHKSPKLIQNNDSNINEVFQLEKPLVGEVLLSPLEIRGRIRGNWFFEAQFPVRLLDANGNELGRSIVSADGEWMTTEFVSFHATLVFSESKTAIGTLIFEKDNPSGLPKHSAEIRLPIRLR